MKTDLSKYHRRPEGPGLLFSEDMTCSALRIEVLGGGGKLEFDGRSCTVVVIDGAGKLLGEDLFVEDMVFVPAGRKGSEEYEFSGRALLVRYAPAGDEPEPIRGHVVLRMGQALGYVRTQYRGGVHGWGGTSRGFNPRGIVYTDKLWGISRDVLAQELMMPAGHSVPVHAHGKVGGEPVGDDFWQMYYVWEGSALVQMGSSPSDIAEIQIRPDSVLVYPNGVAHNVIAGEQGCRYLFVERRRPGGHVNLFLDEEKDYERRLTLRGDRSLEEFLRTEGARNT
ncbi:MAG: cupin domain-containing protein [Planctomycetota bacterium]|jgi:mannose-6-phosphate isomerase-like protein (cupin superfamily)